METYHHSRVVVPHATTTSVKIDISCSPHLNPPRILHCSRRRISRLTSLGAVYGTRSGTNKKGRRESSLSLSESVDMRTHVGVVKSSALAGKIFRRFLKDGKFSLFDDAKRRTRIPAKLCERQRKRERKVWRPPPSSFFLGGSRRSQGHAGVHYPWCRSWSRGDTFCYVMYFQVRRIPSTFGEILRSPRTLPRIPVMYRAALVVV